MVSIRYELDRRSHFGKLGWAKQIKTPEIKLLGAELKQAA